MPTFQTILAGANFRPAEARDVCKSIDLGEELTLIPDPENEYDSFAVQVHAYGHFIGFIPKADNAAVFAALARGEEVGCEVVGAMSGLKPILEITLP